MMIMMTPLASSFDRQDSDKVIMDEVLDAYQDSLKELDRNDKARINLLTMLAEENFPYGSAIVDAIERRIEQVRPPLKLLMLYLVDSILKNSKHDYRPLFRPYLVKIFTSIFRQSDERIRTSMFKVRLTWSPVLDALLLQSLDEKVHEIDPNWPVVRENPSAQTGQALAAQSVALIQPIQEAPKIAPAVPSARPATPPVAKPMVPAVVPNLSPLKKDPVRNDSGRVPDTESPASSQSSSSFSDGSESPEKAMKAPVLPPVQSGVKNLPRIPKKQGVTGKMDTDPVRPTTRLPPLTAAAVRGGRGRAVAPVPVRNGKRSLEQGNQAVAGNGLPKTKIPKMVHRLPDSQENHENFADGPSAPLIRPGIRSTSRMLVRPIRGDHRSARARPYGHPVRPMFERPETAWRGHRPDNRMPLSRIDPPIHMDRPIRPPVGPLLPTPPPPTDNDIYDWQMRDAKAKLEHGEINSQEYQNLLGKLKEDFEIQALKNAMRRSQPGPYPPDLPSANDNDFVYIDDRRLEVRWFGGRAVVIMNGLVFDIGFNGSPVVVLIDHIATTIPVNEERSIYFGTRWHKIKLGGPNFQLVIDGIPFRTEFGQQDVGILIDGQQHRVRLDGPPPQVSIGTDVLNDEIFGRSDREVSEEEKAKEEAKQAEIAKILASPAFQALFAASTTAPPPEPIVQPPTPPQIPEVHVERDAGTDAEIAAAVRKLGLKSWPFGCCLREIQNTSESRRSCEQRFMPSETEAAKRDLLIHQGWALKDQVDTGDWGIDENDFINEKAYDDANLPEEAIPTMFRNFVTSRRPEKANEILKIPEAPVADDSKAGIVSENADDNIEVNPVASGGIKVNCDLCLEQLKDEYLDDEDEYIFKDCIKVKNAADGTEKIFHRDCYEESIRKPQEETVVMNKPSRWKSAVITEKTPMKATSDQPSSSLPASKPGTSDTSHIKAESPSPASNDVEEKSEFVITFGEDDEEEDDEEDFVIKEESAE